MTIENIEMERKYLHELCITHIYSPINEIHILSRFFMVYNPYNSYVFVIHLTLHWPLVRRERVDGQCWNIHRSTLALFTGKAGTRYPHIQMEKNPWPKNAVCAYSFWGRWTALFTQRSWQELQSCSRCNRMCKYYSLLAPHNLSILNYYIYLLALSNIIQSIYTFY